MSLITKYRPSTLKAFVGNKDTAEGIATMLNAKDPKQVYLFTGTYGCGKTTLGRIVAQHVDCNMERDFIEIDAAALSGVKEARALRKNAQYKGLAGGVRVWLIDECHRMSVPAQEILLKLFEEPPAHAYFILATTDPRKLKNTLIDRCAHFTVAPLSDKECTLFLKKIVRREKKKVPDEIIENIIDKAQCRPRSCLNLLEKLIDKDEEGMRAIIEQVKKEDIDAIQLCRALLNGKRWLAIAKLIKAFKEQEQEPEGIRRLVLSYASSVILKSDNIKAFEILDNFKKPYYDNGYADLIRDCYQTVLIEDDDE